MLDLAFLMALIGGAEIAGKQVVAAEGGERLLLDARPSSEDWLDSGGQVIVAEPLWHAAKEVKGLHMALEESLLALCLSGHGEGAARVAQPHHKQLHRDALACQDNHGLTPVDLSILARVKLQGQEYGRALGGALALANI